MKVLIVEDEEIIRESLKADMMRFAAKQGLVCEPFLAESAREGESLFEANRPELVITDINMPKVSGLVLIEKIRKIDKNASIIVLSAYDNFEYVRQAFLAGANDYILKPISFSELSEKVKTQLGQSAGNLPEVKPTADKQLEDALDFINKNINRDISMSDVADFVSLSYSHFSRVFRQHTDMTFPQYLLSVRMKKAEEYLSDPNIKILAVAKKVGYGNDPQHFSRDFSKYAGVSPKTYQQEQQS